MRVRSIAVAALLLCAVGVLPAAADDMMSHVDMNSPAMTKAVQHIFIYDHGDGSICDRPSRSARVRATRMQRPMTLADSWRVRIAWLNVSRAC